MATPRIFAPLPWYLSFYVASVSLVISCGTKPPEPKVEASPESAKQVLRDPQALWTRISNDRHSSKPEALLALAKDASSAATFAPAWRWKFHVLHAELLLDGFDPKAKAEVEGLKKTTPPQGISSDEAQARIDSLIGYVQQREEKFYEASLSYQKASARLPAVMGDPCWAAELRVHHQAQTFRNLHKFSAAEASMALAHDDIQDCGDQAWATLVPFTQANCFNDQFRFEQALNKFSQCVRMIDIKHHDRLTGNLFGNIALCYHNLGDTDNAIKNFDATDAYYKNLGKSITKQQRQDWGGHIGHRARTYLALKRYDEARQGYEKAIAIAKQTADEEFYPIWRTELTSLYIETGNYSAAAALSQEVIKESEKHKDPFVANRAYLNEARLNRLQGRLAEAAKDLDNPLLLHPKDPQIIWSVHMERAHVFDGMHRDRQARKEYLAALDSADAAWKSITKPEYRLTYFVQLRSIYQDYVQFLINHGQLNEALRVNEMGHARLLTEKLNKKSNSASSVEFTHIARVKNATILSYSITPQNAYLWVTTATSIHAVPLKAGAFEKLERLIENHNSHIRDNQGNINDDDGGRALFDLLIGDAAPLIPHGGNVIVIPDGPLAGLNFETLIPPDKNVHYWIEDVNVTEAPSLTLLNLTPPSAIAPNSILLVGDAILSSQEKLPPLGHEDLDYIASLYPNKAHPLLRETASPSGFLNAAKTTPYSWIHLSAHAKSYPQSPLDSFVVLSPETNGGDYKLSARDLAELGLQADLVTLSACQSAGGKNMPGEGLVGLSWAVLRAGARNVVASLWNVEAEATTLLMKAFYKHLSEGKSPAEALNQAKLDMIHNHKLPYTWAAFQLYSR